MILVIFGGGMSKLRGCFQICAARHSAEGGKDLRAVDPVTEATGYPLFSAIFTENRAK